MQAETERGIPANYPVKPDLSGRCVLVTGASGGIGAAVSAAAASRGAQLVLLGRNVPALEQCYDAIEAESGTAPAIYPLDLEGAKPDDYANLADVIADEYGALYGLVHCANQASPLRPFVQVPPIEVFRQFQLAIHGPMLLTQALWPVLAQSESSRVIITLDDLKTTSGAYWLAYGSAQWALRGLLATLAGEGTLQRTRVMGLNPGPRRTALRGQLFSGESADESGDPQAAAAGYLYLLDPELAPEAGRITSL